MHGVRDALVGQCQSSPLIHYVTAVSFQYSPGNCLIVCRHVMPNAIQSLLEIHRRCVAAKMVTQLDTGQK